MILRKEGKEKVDWWKETKDTFRWWMIPLAFGLALAGIGMLLLSSSDQVLPHEYEVH